MKQEGGSTLPDRIGKLRFPREFQADWVDSVSMDRVPISIRSAFVQDIYTRNISLASSSRC